MGGLDDSFIHLDLPEGRRFQVIGFGENAVDLVCRVPQFPVQDAKIQMEEKRHMGGGTIATACTFCARFGLRTRYVGRIGDDEIGEFALRDLEKEPMDVQVETIRGASSFYSVIIVDRPTGSRTILWDRDPKLLYKQGDLRRELLTEGQILHLDGNDPHASVQAARWAKEAGMTVFLDIDKLLPGADELLTVVDFAIPSQGFVQLFSRSGDWREGLRAVGNCCPGFVGVTLGEKGAAALWNDEIREFPAFPISVVDSTGAGDIFHAAFIFAILNGWSLGQCMRFSNAAGALGCTRLGARVGIPAVNEVYSLAGLVDANMLAEGVESN
jgi:sugar/nucleoside kinase (ribokinase family)